MSKRCRAITKRGKPCNAFVLKGEEYCFTHSPTKAVERSEARKLGGLHRRTGHKGDIKKVPKKVRTLADVLLVLDYVLQESIWLDNGVSRSRTLISLSETYIKAIEVSALEERIAILERAYQDDKDRK